MNFNRLVTYSREGLKRIPLWDTKNDELIKELNPSCQINYQNVKVSNCQCI